MLTTSAIAIVKSTTDSAAAPCGAPLSISPKMYTGATRVRIGMLPATTAIDHPYIAGSDDADTLHLHLGHRASVRLGGIRVHRTGLRVELVHRAGVAGGDGDVSVWPDVHRVEVEVVERERAAGGDLDVGVGERDVVAQVAQHREAQAVHKVVQLLGGSLAAGTATSEKRSFLATSESKLASSNESNCQCLFAA